MAVFKKTKSESWVIASGVKGINLGEDVCVGLEVAKQDDSIFILTEKVMEK